MQFFKGSVPLRLPVTKEEWMIYEQETLRTWHLRNCIEAVDGECIPILHQADSGAEFCDYTDFFSLVLFVWSITIVKFYL